MKKYTVALLICISFVCLLTSNNQIETPIDFFNTTFLNDTQAVEKALRTEGFSEVNYTTEDNININALFLDKSKLAPIQGTIIFASGFIPGKKEGLATLYAMLKELPYNMIFFDARGHGKSQGTHLTYTSLKEYTLHEYKDVVATVKFITFYNENNNINPNLILYGLCSGAFHTIKALSCLQKNTSQDFQHIKGIIFDSGWPSFVEVVEPSVISEVKKQCKQWNISFLQPLITFMLLKTYHLFFKAHHEKHPSILEDIETINQPILFIHAHDDTYIPIHLVKKIIAKTKHAHFWLIQNSTHACHHLKHKDLYKAKLLEFLNSISANQYHNLNII